MEEDKPSRKEIFGCVGSVLAALVSGIFLLISAGKIRLPPPLGPTETPTQTTTAITTNIIILDTDTPLPTVIPTLDIPDTDTPLPTIIPTLNIPTLTPSVTPSNTLGNWIIVIGGGYGSIYSAQYDLQTNFSAYSNTAIFYRNSDIRAAIVGFETEENAQFELVRVQMIRSTAYLRELRVWCPTRVIYSDHIECK